MMTLFPTSLSVKSLLFVTLAFSFMETTLLVQVCLDLMVNPAHPELTDPQDLAENPDPRVHRARQDLMDNQAVTAHQAPQAHLDPMDKGVTVENRDLRVRKGLKAPVDLRVPQDPVENQAPGASQEQTDNPVGMEAKEHLDLEANLDLLDQVDNQDHKDHR